MASFVRQSVAAASLGILLFSTSCEMHPPGQMPDVQREQPDPAKVWLNAGKGEAEKSLVSPTPAEAAPHEAR